MKKIIFALVACVAIAACSCRSEVQTQDSLEKMINAIETHDRYMGESLAKTSATLSELAGEHLLILEVPLSEDMRQIYGADTLVLHPVSLSGEDMTNLSLHLEEDYVEVRGKRVYLCTRPYIFFKANRLEKYFFCD